MLRLVCLPADANGRIKVERHLVGVAVHSQLLRLGLDGALQPHDVLELRVHVEQERNVVRVRRPVSM